MNHSSTKKNSREALDKNKNKPNKKDSFVVFYENLKDTPIYACICCQRFNFFSKSTIINEKIRNKINNILNFNL